MISHIARRILFATLLTVIPFDSHASTSQRSEPTTSERNHAIGTDAEGLPMLCRVFFPTRAPSDTRPIGLMGFPSTQWPKGIHAWRTVPSVIRDDGLESFYLEVRVDEPVKRITLELSSPVERSYFIEPGPRPIELRDDGLAGDRAAGDLIYTCGPFRFNQQIRLPDHLFDDASPRGLYMIGGNREMDVHIQELDGGVREFLVSPSIGILHADIPPIPMKTLSSHVVISPHLINIQTSTHNTQRVLRGRGGDGLEAMIQSIYEVLPDVFDFFMLFSLEKLEHRNSTSTDNSTSGFYVPVRNNIRGIGLSLYDNSSFYGSRGVLQGISALDAYHRGIVARTATHELLHRWGAYVGLALTEDGPHYSHLSSVGSLLGGFQWIESTGGTFTPNCLGEGRNGARHAAPLDKYLMGLIEAEKVPAIHLASDTQTLICDRVVRPQDIVRTVTVADIQAVHERREPTPATAQRHFRLAFLAESHERFLTPTEMTFYDILAEHYTRPIPTGEPDPHVGETWVSINRFFGEGTTWRSDLPFDEAAASTSNRPPTIEPIANRTVTVGEQATFPINFSDSNGPPPSFVIIRGGPNGLVVRPDPTTPGIAHVVFPAVTTPGTYTLTAIVPDPQQGEINGSLAARRSFTVTVTANPPPLQFVGDIQVDVQETSAVIAWTTNKPAASEVRYGLTDRYGQIAQPPPTVGYVTSHRVSLTGLTAGTVYHFRAQSVDEVGNIAQSSDHTFQTSQPTQTIPPFGVDHFEFEGADVTAWWVDEYGKPEADQAIRRLAETGADWVGLLMTWYMDASTGTRIFPHQFKTPTDDTLSHAIREVKKLDRKVFLKLHVNVIVRDEPRGNWQDTWAGDIQPSDRAAWFNAYTTYAAHYAVLAQAQGVDLFGFGTELRTMTNPADSNAVRGWDQVIQAVRQRYTGKLTYSAHASEFKRIPFWASCDYLGLDAYPSLTPSGVGRPGIDQLISGWRKNSIDPSTELVDIPTLAQWSTDNGNKKVLLTEVGYRSIEGCADKPWEGRAGVFDEACQKSAYDAAFLALQKQPWFAGMFWWNWVPRPETLIRSEDWIRTGHSPQFKAAQQSLRNFYFGIEPSQIASIEIVNQQWKPLSDVVEVPVGQPINLYAVAKNSTGAILGFAASEWWSLGATRSQGAFEMTSNDVGLARLMCTEEGSRFNVTAQELATKFQDTVVVKFVKAGCSGLCVPSAQYPTIQSAANAARAGDTIVVAPGTYPESVTLPVGVNLVGEAGPRQTVIDASGKPFGVSGGELVQGFTIRNADGPGIPRNTPMRIIHNIIEGNKRSGIDVYGSYRGRDLLIANNVIRNNTTTEHGGGIRAEAVTGEIVNNIIIGNRAVKAEDGNCCPQGGGIYGWSGGGLIVRNNVIMDNFAHYEGGGIAYSRARDPSLRPVIQHNDLWHNRNNSLEDNAAPRDELLPPAEQLINLGNINQDPLLTGDYHLQSGSRGINTGHPDAKYNDKDGSRNDLGIYGGPHQFP